MLALVTGDSDESEINQTLSIRHYKNDALYARKPSCCEVKCHDTCQTGIRDRCLRCYKRCWLLMGYKLDSGHIISAVKNPLLDLDLPPISPSAGLEPFCATLVQLSRCRVSPTCLLAAPASRVPSRRPLGDLLRPTIVCCSSQVSSCPVPFHFAYSC